MNLNTVKCSVAYFSASLGMRFDKGDVNDGECASVLVFFVVDTD
jgi:hypothetical protein